MSTNVIIRSTGNLLNTNRKLKKTSESLFTNVIDTTAAFNWNVIDTFLSNQTPNGGLPPFSLGNVNNIRVKQQALCLTMNCHHSQKVARASVFGH